MPRVPTAEYFGVAQSAQPSNQLSTPLSGEQATVGLRQIGRQAEATQDFNNTLLNLRVRAQERANELRVQDAMNKVRDSGNRMLYDPKEGLLTVRGEAALNRPSGMSLEDEYDERFGQELSAIESELANDVQKQEFQQRASVVRAGLREQAQRHLLQEYQDYESSVLEGALKLSLDEAVLNYQDAQIVSRAVGEAEQTIRRIGELGGKPPEWVEAKIRETLNATHTAVLEAALGRGDIEYADRHLKNNVNRLAPQNAIKYNGVITQEKDLRLARDVATQVYTTIAQQVRPTDFDRLVAITIQSESSGRRYGADGKLLESSKGAKGEMQVLDGTNTDPGYGVTPARDDSPDERARVGRDYLEAMIHRYGGDVAKAWAAYNFGPANFDNALKEAEKTQQPWINLVPVETQDYVRKNVAAFRQPGPTESLYAAKTRAIQQVTDILGTDNPDRLATATTIIERQFSALETAEKEAQDAALANAYRELDRNGGDFSALPLEIRQALPASKIPQLQRDAVSMAQNSTTTDQRLKFELTTDTKRLATMSPDELWALRSRLSRKDFEAITTKYNQLRSPNAEASANDINNEAVTRALTGLYIQLGIESTGKNADVERINLIRDYVEERIAVEQNVKGRMLSDVETKAFVDALATQTVPIPGTFSTSNELVLTMKVRDIPTPTRDRVEEVLKSQGIDDPTDAQIVRTYWRYLALQSKYKQKKSPE